MSNQHFKRKVRIRQRYSRPWRSVYCQRQSKRASASKVTGTGVGAIVEMIRNKKSPTNTTTAWPEAIDRQYGYMHVTYGYIYMIRMDHGDPWTATVRADDPLGTMVRGKKNFSLSLTPVLNPTQDYSSRDKKIFYGCLCMPSTQTSPVFAKITLRIARQVRIRIF